MTAPMAAPAAPALPAPAYAGGALLLGTIAIAFCHNGVLAAGRLAAPLVALDLGAGAALVGALAALFTVVPILATIRFGRWVERAGTLRPALVAAAILIGATALMTLRPGLAALAVAALLIGAGAVFGHVSITRAVAGFGDAATRARNLSHLAVGYSLCQFVAPVLTGIAYDHLGARGAYGLLCLFVLVSLGLIGSGRHLLGGRPEAPPGGPVRRDMAGLLAAPGLPLLLVLHGMFAAGLVFYALAAPLHGTEAGLSATQIGSLYGMLSLGALTSRLAAPRLLRMLAAPGLLALALALAGAVCAALPIFSVWAVLALVSYLFGCCLGLGQPVTMALIYDAAPEGRINESIGLSMAVTNVLQLLTPLGLGLVARAWGVAPMIWVFAAVLALTAAAGALGRPREARA